MIENLDFLKSPLIRKQLSVNLDLALSNKYLKVAIQSLELKIFNDKIEGFIRIFLFYTVILSFPHRSPFHFPFPFKFPFPFHFRLNLYYYGNSSINVMNYRFNKSVMMHFTDVKVIYHDRTRLILVED